MGKVSPKLKELSRRTQRQIWRDDARIHLLASEPNSTSQPVSRPRAQKAGRRLKAIQLPDVLSLSKVKKTKHAHEKTDGTNLNNSSGLKSSNSITSLFDELRSLFGQGPKDIRVIADMEATYDSLEARFPAGPITPPNSSLDLKGQGVFAFPSSVASSESVLPISASSSSECESSHKNLAQIIEDPFIVIGTPLLVKNESISETHTASTSRFPARGLKPSAVALETPRTPTRKVTSSLASPPDTDPKESPSVVNTTRKRPDSRSKFMSAYDPVPTATGKSDPAYKKPSTSIKLFPPQDTGQRKVPGKIRTPDSITRVRTVMPAKLEPGAASPSVKIAARVQTDPKIHKLPLKPVLSSFKRRAPPVTTAAKPVASDTKLSKRGSTQQMTTTSTPNKPASDVRKSPLNSRMLAVVQNAPSASISSNKSNGINHMPPKKPTILSTADNFKFSTAKSPMPGLSETKNQTASKIANIVVIPPSGSTLNDISTEWFSSEFPHKVPIPYLLPIPGQRPVSTFAVPAVAEPEPSDRTSLCFSSVGNLMTLASSTTLLCSSPEHTTPARKPHVPFAVPVVPSRSSPSLSPRSCASRTTSPLTHVASPADEYTNTSHSSIVLPASTPAKSLITSIEIMNPGSSVPAKDTRNVDSARRSNLMRMFKVRWTTGDDQLPFNFKSMGGLAGDDTPKEELGNVANNDVKIVHRRPAVLDTLNAFLWR